MFGIAARSTLRIRRYSKIIRRFFSTQMDGGNPRVVVEFRGKTAVVRMQHGENRIVPEFVRDFHAALDEIEKLATRLVLTLLFNMFIRYIQEQEREGAYHNGRRQVLLQWTGSRELDFFQRGVSSVFTRCHAPACKGSHISCSHHCSSKR